MPATQSRVEKLRQVYFRPLPRKATPEQKTARTVDTLGKIKAKLAELKALEEALIEELKAGGPSIYSGDLFEANVFASSSSRLNKEELFKKHKKLQQWYAECTESKDILVCKLQAKVVR